MQLYIYNYAMCYENGPYISQPLHYFKTQVKAYLIIEYIELIYPPLLLQTLLRERQRLSIGFQRFHHLSKIW